MHKHMPQPLHGRTRLRLTLTKIAGIRRVSLPLLVPVLSPTFVWHSSHLSSDAWLHFLSNLTTVQFCQTLALTLWYPGRPCLLFKAFSFRCKRISCSGPTWMHPSAPNFTTGSKGCVYQVLCHEIVMSLSFEGSSGRIQLGFFSDFSTKKCAAWVPKG